MIDNSNWIRIRCELCGVDSETMNDWSGIRCPLHGVPICGHCCHKCDYKKEFSGLYSCSYKTPDQRRREAHRKATERFNQENMRVAEAYKKKRKEKARAYAIKRAKAERRERRKHEREAKNG